MTNMTRVNPTADRYSVVLWAIREHHRTTRKWQVTAAELATLLPPPADGNTDPTLSVARTLQGLVAAGLVWSSHTHAKEARQRRMAEGGRRYGVESELNRPARYATSILGDTVNDMLDLVGNRDYLAGERRE